MSETARTDIKISRKTVSETGATLLVAGGLISAFGAASCCALPVLLGSLGLASAWLGSLGLVAGPHRGALLPIAFIGLVGGGLLMWRPARRHARRVRFVLGRYLRPWLGLRSPLGPSCSRTSDCHPFPGTASALAGSAASSG